MWIAPVHMMFASTIPPSAETALWLPPLLLVLGVALLAGVVLLAIGYRHANRLREIERSISEQAKQAQQTCEQIDDLRDRVGELIGAAQRSTATMNEKVARLDAALVAAEERLRVLDEIMAQVAMHAQQAMAASSGSGDDEAKPHSPGSSRAASTSQQSQQAQSHDDMSASTTAKSRSDLDPLTRAVYDLADTGCTPVEIAKELQEQVGKVELILALRSM